MTLKCHGKLEPLGQSRSTPTVKLYKRVSNLGIPSLAGPGNMASSLPGFQLLTCKAAIRVFSPSSQLVIYLTAEKRDRTGEDCGWGGARTFCSFCVLCKGLAHLPLPLSQCCASSSACSGERPRGGVQSGGQQGVPLPDKNRLF